MRNFTKKFGKANENFRETFRLLETLTIILLTCCIIYTFLLYSLCSFIQREVKDPLMTLHIRWFPWAHAGTFFHNIKENRFTWLNALHVQTAIIVFHFRGKNIGFFRSWIWFNNVLKTFRDFLSSIIEMIFFSKIFWTHCFFNIVSSSKLIEICTGIHICCDTF